jgi:hypothetical protein
LIKSEKKVLLKHKSGWCIVCDNNFPSQNFIVFKARTSAPLQNLTSHNVAYCGSLKNALNRLFQELIIEHTKKDKKYKGSMKDLQRAIEAVHRDFEQLLKSKRKTE